MKNNRIAVIIVSAGYSSRMGDFKPFLKFGDKSAVEMVVDTYKSSGIRDIIVVTGYKGSEVADKLKSFNVRCVQNENYAAGMFTSVIKGVKALDTGVSAFFMQPVDIPLVKRYTVDLLKNKYAESGKGIIYPEFRGEVGHPPLIDCKYRENILHSNGEGGLKKILKEYSDDSIAVPVFDRTILMDMDTKDDYEKLLEYFNAAAPDMKECFSILESYSVPENIIRHCEKVSEVAEGIYRSLYHSRYELDEYALKAAAMLHDIAKSREDHARVGERILKKLGYGKVGAIIGSHTDIDVDYQGKITEGEILYLADKLVKEDQVISIDERFRRSLEKYKGSPEILAKIECRRNAAYTIIEKIEATTGRVFIYG